MFGRVFDIETVVNATLVRDCFYPGMKDAEAALQRKKEELLKESGSDFLPLVFHQPVCIAVARYSVETYKLEQTVCIEAKGKKGTQDHIDNLVRTWWGACEKWEGTPLVSFNGRGFDFPILELHAIRLGLNLKNYFKDSKTSYRHRYGPHIDVMDLLSNYGAVRKVGKLDYLLKMMGLPGKGAIEGKDVDLLYKEGKFNFIEEYCIDDVKQTFEIFKKVELSRGNLGAGN